MLFVRVSGDHIVPNINQIKLNKSKHLNPHIFSLGFNTGFIILILYELNINYLKTVIIFPGL